MIAVMTLFGEVDLLPNIAATESGPCAAVAIEQSVDRLLDYRIPGKLMPLIAAGQRVRVPLGRGNKSVFGFVIALKSSSDHPKLKSIAGIDDERSLLDRKLLELARWIGRYYVCPLGTVIDSIIPSAVKKRIGVGYAQIVTLAVSRERLQEVLEGTKAPKRRAIIGRLLQLEPGAEIEINRLAGEAHVTPPTVRKLRTAGLIAIQARADVATLVTEQTTPGETQTPHALNSDQQRVVDDLFGRIRTGGFSSNLLFGVTGSGKTEIYLQCIQQVVSSGHQAIVLVPEIALTPQTVNRFTARFPRVAVLHSGLSQTQRHRYWQQIHTGQADVIVGARSAVFAPAPRLGMIVVDEEHESSYKQDSAPRYNARDVALKRGQLHDIPVILGSATPSLESWMRAGSGLSATDGCSVQSRSHLLRLPNRVRGLQLPKTELIDLREEMRQRKGVHLLSRRLEFLLNQTVEAKQQAILLLNRRGYSSYIFCPSCNHVMECKYCDTTLTYHRTPKTDVQSAAFEPSVHKGQLHCHYCLAVNPLPTACPECGKKLNLFGMGTQRAEEELNKRFPHIRFARVDGDSMRGTRDYERVLQKFARREVDVLVGTQMIAKGLDYPNVTLVGVINSDTALALPDFRASERTFQLLTQVAGRAGRGDVPGRVVMQSFITDSPVIQSAMKQDYEQFAQEELVHRAQFNLPPTGRMARIVIRDTDNEKLNRKAAELAGAIGSALTQAPVQVKITGPAPCAIGRIAGYFRVQIVLQSESAAAIQTVLAAVRNAGGLARNDRIAVDVDPVSLL